MVLTLLIIQNAELPLEYLRANLVCLQAWNEDGLRNTQVIVVSQLQNSDPVWEVCQSAGFPVKLVTPKQDYVNGYPVWNVMASLREVWPLMDGQYVSMQHPEFLWLPGTLRKTLDQLSYQRPYLALGNLRRSGEPGMKWRGDGAGCQPLMSALNSGELEGARRIAETMPTSHWIYWQQDAPRPGPAKWLEDVFFADREWLQAWRMAHHGEPQYLQDVYDLMGRATLYLGKMKLMPPVVRLSLETNKTIHLWHPRKWDNWSAAMRDYFIRDRRFLGTEFANAGLWKNLIALRTKEGGPFFRHLSQMRIGPKGTVNRYGKALRAWLAKGGLKSLREFYSQNGFEARNRRMESKTA